MRYGDPVWCELEQRRVRFARMDGGMVVVMDDTGRELPDYRHVSQVRPIK